MIDGEKVVLRNKRLSDADNDYMWQKDPELAWLDAAPPLDHMFEDYLADYESELLFTSDIRRPFAVETIEGKHIGNCVYYNIDKVNSETEIGIMLGDRQYWDKGYGTDTIKVLLNHIFRHTTLNRIYLKTLESNIRAHKCFQKCGFQPCGHLNKDGYRFLLMEINRDSWLEEQKIAMANH